MKITIELPDNVANLLQTNHTLIPELRHMPSTLESSIEKLVKTILANEKIRSQQFEDKFIVQIAVPKSASSIIRNVIRNIIGFKKNTYGSYMLANEDTNLRPELMLDFLDGGIVKFHPQPLFTNLKFIHLVKAKTILQFRHPADQLTALFFHIVKAQDPKIAGNFCVDHFMPAPLEVLPLFLKDEELIPEVLDRKFDKFIKHRTSDGYLLNMLSWMENWTKLLENYNKNHTLLYESFFTNPKKEISKLAKFVRGDDISDIEEELQEQSIQILDKHKLLAAKNDKVFHRGYSGRIGAYKDYFSREHAELYNNKIKLLLATGDFKHVEKIYPNLIINPEECIAAT